MAEDWKSINHFHDMPKRNNYAQLIWAGRKYYLRSKSGEVICRNTYTCIGMKNKLAAMRTEDGFEFCVLLDELSDQKPEGRRSRELKKYTPWKKEKEPEPGYSLPIRRAGRKIIPSDGVND